MGPVTTPNLHLAVGDHGQKAVVEALADVEKAASKLAEASQEYARVIALDALTRAQEKRTSIEKGQ